MARLSQWIAPATILGFLVAGVALALGHHFFYKNLAGQEAPTDNYPIDVLE